MSSVRGCDGGTTDPTVGASLELEAFVGDIVSPMVGNMAGRNVGIGMDGVVGDTGNPNVGDGIVTKLGEIVGTLVGNIVDPSVGAATGLLVDDAGDPKGDILVGSSLGASPSIVKENSDERSYSLLFRTATLQ